MNPKLLRIRNERQLVSVMNSTKWKELCDAFEVGNEINPKVRYKRIDSNDIFGFSPVWWNEMLDESPAIEWLDFELIKREYRGHLISDKETDISKELFSVMEKFNIPYSIEQSYLRIWGYINQNEQPFFVQNISKG